NNNLVTERTTDGTLVTQRQVFQQPLNIEFLPDGGMLVICRNQILQWNKDGKQEWACQRPNYDILGGCRMPNGDVLFVTNAYNGENAFRLDQKGEYQNKNNDPKKRIQFGRIQQLQSMHAFAEDKVLVCEFNKVAEYDLKTGKQTWSHTTPPNSAQSCQRLPNGNTLISLLNQNQLIEVDPSGETVWEYQAKDGLRVGRAYRR
ncbi:MAG TPA: PQQ-binding-like beta-propeller repeat protein, partial [Gemmata sp.]|nr:PQQ-binding-like beta-propeller repeat protein [Gemmata sp.]